MSEAGIEVCDVPEILEAWEWRWEGGPGTKKSIAGGPQRHCSHYPLAAPPGSLEMLHLGQDLIYQGRKRKEASAERRHSNRSGHGQRPA
jgi:hypothetical protein